ncbi:MAG: ATP-binding protein, partial [Bryocella sp.]
MPSILAVISAVSLAGCFALLLAYLGARRRAKKLSLALVHAREELVQDQTILLERKQLDTLKDEFISTVSHELRTPLTSIRGALGLLSSGVLGHMDEQAKNLLRIASTNTDRLARLINDILDLERTNSGRAPLHLRRCYVAEVLQQASDSMRAMADGNEITIAVEIAAEAQSLSFEGDADRMQQVLVNLLSNAIKFSPRGSTIHLIAQSEADDLVLRVKDAGRGVPNDKLEAIFGRFQQVEDSDARQKGGTGLGLAICRSIVAQHGGTIHAERNDADGSASVGTTFALRIPRLAAVSEITPLPLAPQGAILVVDDDAGVRQVVSEQLRRQGYTVLEADRGEKAIELASTHHVEAVLLDLYMPGMTGWQTLEKLRANPATASVPVVVLSVLSPATNSPEGTSALSNAQGWVQKPFNESLLLAELGRVLHA